MRVAFVSNNSNSPVGDVVAKLGNMGVPATPDDVVTLNDMRIPVGRPVMINLKSKDVIHSFYVPNFRIKHDANPGYVTRMWFEAKSSGKFEIACSQMCGWAHYKMKGDLTVLPQKEDRP